MNKLNEINQALLKRLKQKIQQRAGLARDLKAFPTEKYSKLEQLFT